MLRTSVRKHRNQEQERNRDVGSDTHHAPHRILGVGRSRRVDATLGRCRRAIAFLGHGDRM
jgi:hypothetical protein